MPRATVSIRLATAISAALVAFLAAVPAVAEDARPAQPKQPPSAATGGVDLDQIFKDAKRSLLPLEPGQIKSFERTLDATSKAVHPSPPPQTVSRSASLSFQPGTVAPVLRMAPGFVSSVAFVDATGAPWPITSNTVGNAQWFSVVRPETGDNNMLTVNALTANVHSNIVLTLKGQDTPIVIQLAMDDEMADGKPGVADTLLSVRMDKAGPNARLPEIGAAVGSPAAGEIMAFLDGVPPQGAKPLLMQPAVAGVSAWEYAGRHYIRSPHAVRWPARVSVSHGTGGFDVYVVPATPAIVLSVDGQSQNMALSSKPTQLEVAQ